MVEPGFIGSMPIDVWTALKTGSVPDSLRANREWMRHALEQVGGRDPVDAAMQLERVMQQQAGRSSNWDSVDYERMKGEYTFAWNWSLAGAPIFHLTHNTAAVLSTTRAPEVEFDHAPYAAFLISVPHAYLPLLSERPAIIRWIGVESGTQMGVGGGRIIAIPDADTLGNAVGVGPDGRLSEDELDRRHGHERVEWQRLLGVAVRLTANVIQFVSQYRGSDCIRKTSGAKSPTQTFEVRPPADVVVDKAFRDLAAQLVGASDFKGARRALAHIVRGHWRNQAVGAGRSERRMTWIKPFRRGDESLGAVIQRTIRLTEGS
jgi:hypothetical protein